MQKIKATTIAIHLAGWLLFLSFPLVFIHAEESGSSIFKLVFDLNYWEFSLCYIALFYINSLFLIPRLFLKKKYLDYTLIVVILLAAVYFFQPFDRLLRNSNNGRPNKTFSAEQFSDPGRPGTQHQMINGMPPPPPDMPDQSDSSRHAFGSTSSEGRQDMQRLGPPPPNGRMRHIDTTSLFIFVMIMALSTAVEITREWNTTERRASLAEAGKANAELSFLKAQINPHFLFNTLNNIYTLAVTGNEHTADSIMKLSNIMRYVTDEVTEDFVLLQNEIDCIDNYIDLQRLRIGKKTEIDYSVEGNAENKVVAPLVFMTFIENVFKYGISKQEYSKLTIQINIDDDKLHLFCQNPDYSNKSIQNRHGIGIKNTLQRLVHLYPGRHKLDINTQNNHYTVNMTLYNKI
ncbi:sensor histidine kinase [Mucilaginibacter sp. KACC 22063]|uniref:sensor histidine kinase n=1 Tax=Mucilaginibacter sp. KACC 22063 TaxID=3025666 RepID=UPI0023663F34|nr:sensor histidine kinase [Mucilaginibacter sp. KACC 22063]WDF54189.1 sensor histidine kinase [Mucilaginibacter sp. KACC 22063]